MLRIGSEASNAARDTKDSVASSVSQASDAVQGGIRQVSDRLQSVSHDLRTHLPPFTTSESSHCCIFFFCFCIGSFYYFFTFASLCRLNLRPIQPNQPEPLVASLSFPSLTRTPQFAYHLLSPLSATAVLKVPGVLFLLDEISVLVSV